MRGVRGVPSVDVPSFAGVVEEGRVPKQRGSALAPLPWVPGEILDEAGFEDPEDWGLLAGGLQLLGNLEIGSGYFLSQDSDREEVAGGDADYLVSGGLDASTGSVSFEFDGIGLAQSCVEHEVDPV